MPDLFASILTRVGVALLEALVVRLVQAMFEAMFRNYRMA